MRDMLPSRNYNYIQIIGDGVLRFPTWQHYIETMNHLKNDYEVWNEYFYNQYCHLKREEIMDIEDLLGFNEFQPLIDFKNMMNIKGLQKN